MRGLFFGMISGLFWGALLSGGGLAAVSLWDSYDAGVINADMTEKHSEQDQPAKPEDEAASGKAQPPEPEPIPEPEPTPEPMPEPEPAVPANIPELPLPNTDDDTTMAPSERDLSDVELAAQMLDIDVVDPTTVPEIPNVGVIPDAVPSTDLETADEQMQGDMDMAAQVLGIDVPNPSPENLEPTPAVLSTDETPTKPGVKINALATYVVDFENPKDMPLLSVVLVDIAGSPLSDESLTVLPRTIGFAIDAARPDATQVARRYRKAGFEVLLLGKLPEGADARDVEVAYDAYLRAMPEVIAVLDIGSSAGISKQVVDIISDTGLGLVTLSKGLHTAEKAATNAGVPSSQIYRELDAKGETVSVIRNHLDRAVFIARQSGTVVLLGKTRSETIEALLSWALGSSAKKVAIAPISAILLKK